jgi:hypothetical protein
MRGLIACEMISFTFSKASRSTSIWSSRTLHIETKAQGRVQVAEMPQPQVAIPLRSSTQPPRPPSTEGSQWVPMPVVMQGFPPGFVPYPGQSVQTDMSPPVIPSSVSSDSLSDLYATDTGSSTRSSSIAWAHDSLWSLSIGIDFLVVQWYLVTGGQPTVSDAFSHVGVPLCVCPHPRQSIQTDMSQPVIPSVSSDSLSDLYATGTSTSTCSLSISWVHDNLDSSALG